MCLLQKSKQLFEEAKRATNRRPAPRSPWRLRRHRPLRLKIAQQLLRPMRPLQQPRLNRALQPREATRRTEMKPRFEVQPTKHCPIRCQIVQLANAYHRHRIIQHQSTRLTWFAAFIGTLQVWLTLRGTSYTYACPHASCRVWARRLFCGYSPRTGRGSPGSAWPASDSYETTRCAC